MLYFYCTFKDLPRGGVKSTVIKRINEKGFTLIELLIVIAVIAILAVAILSAINPVEQLRKADDSRRRSDTAELLNALERYYTTYRQYPWLANTPDVDCPMLAGYTGTACPTGLGTADVQGLVLMNELKSEFVNRELGEYFVTEDANNQVHVCFDPVSTTWSQETIALFGNNGQPWASGVRYVCVPE